MGTPSSQHQHTGRSGPGEVMTAGELALMFRVNTKTVIRWDEEGKLGEGASFRTPGGHRRFHRDRIAQKYPALFAANGQNTE